jgi:hypothetical protein
MLAYGRFCGQRSEIAKHGRVCKIARQEPGRGFFECFRVSRKQRKHRGTVGFAHAQWLTESKAAD